MADTHAFVIMDDEVADVLEDKEVVSLYKSEKPGMSTINKHYTNSLYRVTLYLVVRVTILRCLFQACLFQKVLRNLFCRQPYIPV